MRSARIRTAWKNKRRGITSAEHAAAVAAAAWRIALNAAKNLHGLDFIYDGDAQRLGVIREYLYFFIHAADRSAQAQCNEDDERDEHNEQKRADFITELARECARHYLENQRDLIAQGPDADAFIAQLNRRAGEYAATRFADDQPGASTYRLLGARVQECMGDGQTNKWTQDQVTEIDGPEAFAIFNKALTALNRSARQSERTD